MNYLIFYPMILGFGLMSLFGSTESYLPTTIYNEPLVHTIITSPGNECIIIVDDIANFNGDPPPYEFGLTSTPSNLTVLLDATGTIDRLLLIEDEIITNEPSTTCLPISGEIELKIEQLRDGYLFVFSSSNNDQIYQYQTTDNDVVSSVQLLLLPGESGGEEYCLYLKGGLQSIS